MLKTRAGDIIGNVPGRPRFLRIGQVCDATGLPISTVYELVAAGNFPKQVRLTRRSVAWIEQEVLAWQEARIAERDGQ
jgi:prophage regulatory protein